jgi:hypothetical protein
MIPFMDSPRHLFGQDGSAKVGHQKLASRFGASVVAGPLPDRRGSKKIVVFHLGREDEPTSTTFRADERSLLNERSEFAAYEPDV